MRPSVAQDPERDRVNARILVGLALPALAAGQAYAAIEEIVVEKEAAIKSQDFSLSSDVAMP